MAEITTTQSFSDGDTVTATKLNNIQGNASIQPEAITNRSAETSIDQANDILLIYDASATALKKVTPSDLIKAGTSSNLPITGNATIGGTLGVTGNTTIGGTLGVTGAITASSTINGTTIPSTKTLVTTDGTQSLTNKTLSSPTINTSTISGGTINNATIGGTTASTGSFTSLSATSLSVTNTITGSVSGNAETATNGVVTSGSYSDPSWIASLSKSKVGLGNVPNTDCTNASNISSGTLGLARLGILSTGQVVAGNAGTPTATTLSGDATIGATGTITLANSGATAGTYGSSSQIPAITIDAKGRITSASNTSFSTTPADGSITPSKLSQPLTRATAVASTSGTAIDFTGIPSWVKRITVMFQGVSTTSTSNIIIQVGTASAFIASGYLGTSMVNSTGAGTSNLSTGFTVGDSQNTYIRHGFATILNISSNLWVANGVFGLSGSAYNIQFAGSVDAGGVLTRVRVTTVNGTDTFDAGTINIMYE